MLPILRGVRRFWGCQSTRGLCRKENDSDDAPKECPKRSCDDKEPPDFTKVSRAKIGINGFGRLGRLILRAALNSDVEVVGINHPGGCPPQMAYAMKFDSTHGRYNGTVKSEKNHLIIDGNKIKLINECDRKKIEWCGAEFIVEANPTVTSKLAKENIKDTVKHALVMEISESVPLIIVGVNHEKYSPDMPVVSVGNCLANAAGPLLKILHEEFGIESAVITNIHPMSQRQKILDDFGPPDNKPEWRLGRSAGQNIVLVCSNIGKAIDILIPELRTKVGGSRYHVPVFDVSCVDLAVKFRKDSKYNDVKCKIREAVEGKLHGILGYTEDYVVSSDLITTSYSAVFDANGSIELCNNYYKLVSWYDNEYGFACRIIDLIKCMFKRGKGIC